ncbi:hypothetical protein [Caulobacter sp. 17J65-9]|uniref:hypothetical protein n=1 Tax=Caulobacter sp. 17J65-9 TaxID=2709382 RepID=UPI0013C97AD7|nr:hypothetical protein [Caulobacter sp. 17J65-9]NEX93205.1 hypothetical protein [Caulobacter sp. 17J65-9]
MSGLILALSLAAAAPAARAPDLAKLQVFATLEVRDAFDPTVTRLKMGTFDEDAAGTPTYWFVREQRDRKKRLIRRDVADSGACPGALAPLQAMEQLHLPSPDVPGFGRDADVTVMDGADYRLTGTVRHSDGQDGEFMIQSNVFTPLATWSDDMLRALEGCWRRA